MIVIDEERLQQLAHDCLDISERTEDARTASEMLRISNRVLQLATPTMLDWEERIPRARWLPAPRQSVTSIMRDAVLNAKSWIERHSIV
jgi:hypothetical protein